MSPISSSSSYPWHPHPLSGLSGWLRGDSLVEPFLVLGKFRRKRGEYGLCIQRGAEKAENKVSTYIVGTSPFSILPIWPSLSKGSNFHLRGEADYSSKVSLHLCWG